MVSPSRITIGIIVVAAIFVRLAVTWWLRRRYSGRTGDAEPHQRQVDYEDDLNLQLGLELHDAIKASLKLPLLHNEPRSSLLYPAGATQPVLTDDSRAVSRDLDRGRAYDATTTQNIKENAFLKPIEPAGLTTVVLVPMATTDVVIKHDEWQVHALAEAKADVPGSEICTLVNPKQFHRILKRRVARQRLDEYLTQKCLARRGSEKYLPNVSAPKGCMRRPRGPGGRFLTFENAAVVC